MLKALGYKAQAFNRHYSTISQGDPDHVKEVCFDIQVSLVKFFTTAVNTIRNPESAIQLYKQETGNCLHGQEGPGSSFQSEFIIVTQSLSEVLARIDNLIPHQSTLTEEINSLDVAAVTNQVPLLELPTKTYSNFFNRVETFDKIDQILSRDGSTTNLRSTALYGLGGVGKSSIAAGYMNRKIEEKKYDALFWVYSEDTAALRQSFTDIAIRLKLPGAQPNLHDENLKLVQNWLRTTYDKVLLPYWPIASHGHALITTRDHNLVHKFATAGLEIASWDTETGSEFLLFLSKDNISHDIQAEGISATDLAEKLGGHALGVEHMAGLIRSRSWSISEFTRIYLKDPRRVHKKELEALWDISFGTLEKDSRVFLGVVSILVSDHIAQTKLFSILSLTWDSGDNARIHASTDTDTIYESSVKIFLLHRIGREQIKWAEDLTSRLFPERQTSHPLYSISYRSALAIFCGRGK
ncbi:uncharacterized protein RCO7_04091 [Rhynchosporium graminicola]|uniref:NB-ARC domain-containing protein n=1 Tax=Rhynchosporium graminicola TaxID=2792576 RepID=A0A1E1LFF2_9HELO|nr:uncharacterized protein RCO7_04091 [Rhynchosporium commune]